MQIKLHNVDAGRTIDVTGPQVEFLMKDDGRSNVAMVLSLEDGTHLNYPSGGAKLAPQATTLKPGEYFGVVTIVSLLLAKGRSYDSSVSVDGVLLASAKGEIADGKESDQGSKIFRLRVA